MQISTHDDMSWTVAGAKARLSEVMERAQLAPQTITSQRKAERGRCFCRRMAEEDCAPGITRRVSIGIASAWRRSGY